MPKLQLIIYIICAIITCQFSYGQQKSNAALSVELHVGSQSSFGPYDSRAEIAGGLDSLYFDGKKHYSPGYKSNAVFECLAGFKKNYYQLQGSVSFCKKDIGLIQTSKTDEHPFVLANMLSFRFSSMINLTNKPFNNHTGLYTGLFIGCTIPVSYTINNQTKTLFGVDQFNTSAQFCWGIDMNYRLKLSKNGWYTIAGLSGTMPGLMGGIGKIQLQSNSAYSIIRDRFQMYAINAFVGIGKNFER